MAFTPRSFNTILTDMVAYVQSRTELTDFTVGSSIRTVLEAAALEDDEQYYQMVQLLDIFSYTTAAGENLDRRLADFNIVRIDAQTAFGLVAFTNGNIKTGLAASDAVSGSTSVTVFDSSPFPVTGFPYTIRIAEASTRVQDASVLALDTATNTFTLSAGLLSDSEVGDRVSLVSGASSQSIPISTNVQSPATTNEDSQIYRSTEIATIPAGNYYSNEVNILATSAGPNGNTGSSRVTQFVGAAPFTGAGVLNASSISGGTSRESDEELRARAVEKLQSLSRGTVLSLKAESVGVTDPATGQRVISSNVLEDFAADPDEVIVYIDDGTGLTPDVVSFAQSPADGLQSQPQPTITVLDGTNFPSSGFVFVENLIGNTFLKEYVSKTGNVLTLGSVTTIDVEDAALVRRVNVVSEGTEEGQRRFSLRNPPIVRSTDLIWIKEPAAVTWTLLTPTVDYVLNKGTGEFTVIDEVGLGLNTEVIATYSYYTNLIAETQKVLEGFAGDYANYPGVKAAGVFLTVEAPSAKRVTVVLSITAETTFVETDLAPLVQANVEDYIRGLKIGEDVIRSKITDVSHDVQGVRSVSVQEPSSDIIVLEYELPTPFDTNDDSLVTILS
jgi:uncharacterized phage protein gp47/JayE